MYSFLMLGLGLVWVGITLPDPYLLPWADTKHIPGWQAGILFSAQPFAVVAIQPFIPTLARGPGYLGLLPFGFAVSAVGHAGFAAAPAVYDGGPKLFAMLAASDLLAGIAEGIIETCSYTLLAQKFADVLSQAVGHAEAWIGVGTFFGPFIGGALFSLAGFSGPSSLLSVSMLTLAFVAICFSQPKLSCYIALDEGDHDEDSKQHCLRRADRLVFGASAASALLSGAVCGIYAPLLSEYYTTTFLWSEAVVGQLFAAAGAFYMATASQAGRICDSGPAQARASVILGGVLVAMALWLCTAANPLLSVAGLFLIGASTAMLQVPVLGLLEQSVAEGCDVGLPASVANGAHALGSGLSPLLAMPFREEVGFEEAMEVCGMIATCATLGLSVIMLVRQLPS